MINSEKSSVGIQKVNQGCVWSWFHILDYHHWGVKRAFRHRKKRQTKSKLFHIINHNLLIFFVCLLSLLCIYTAVLSDSECVKLILTCLVFSDKN